MLARHGAHYRGWLANVRAPEVFARHLATVHVPRRYYAEQLPGIPTIRVFEALACGIPLVSRPLGRQRGPVPTRRGLPRRPHRRGNDQRTCKPLRDDPDLRAAARRQRPRAGSAPATPAATAPTSFSPSPPASAQPSRWSRAMKIAFYGSSLLSAYWNGAATYYRGLLSRARAPRPRHHLLRARRLRPAEHRDIDPPAWARVVVWPATEAAARAVTAEAAAGRRGGQGERRRRLRRPAARGAVLQAARPEAIRIFWDVDAPATLAEMRADPGHPLAPRPARLDLVLTYGGGPPVIAAYEGFGARACMPVYNALDPDDPPPGAARPAPSPPTSPSSPTASPTARPASSASSSTPPPACPDRASSSAATAGTTSR